VNSRTWWASSPRWTAGRSRRAKSPGRHAGHDNFQNAQAFLDGGGRRGLQEQILLSGTWNLNPWFVQVEQVPMVQIPIGYVGVVISFVGAGARGCQRRRVQARRPGEPGHKGVWVTPLYPGKHPVKHAVMKVELVPTTNIVLNWANRTEAHNYDEKLSSITVRSKDGFAFNLDVAQIIHVGALDAPKVISRGWARCRTWWTMCCSRLWGIISATRRRTTRCSTS
jgi:uncharacterized membrane protein YqiK